MADDAPLPPGIVLSPLPGEQTDVPSSGAPAAQEQLGQHNLIHRALSSFGDQSAEALQRGLRGEATPQEVAREFFLSGPMGPRGMANPGRVRITRGPTNFGNPALNRADLQEQISLMSRQGDGPGKIANYFNRNREHFRLDRPVTSNMIQAYLARMEREAATATTTQTGGTRYPSLQSLQEQNWIVPTPRFRGKREPPMSLGGETQIAQADMPGITVDNSQRRQPPTTQALPLPRDDASEEELDAYNREMRGEFFGQYSQQLYQQLVQRRDQIRSFPPTIEGNDEVNNINRQLWELYGRAQRQRSQMRGDRSNVGANGERTWWDTARDVALWSNPITAPFMFANSETGQRFMQRLPRNVGSGLASGTAHLVESLGQAGRALPNPNPFPTLNTTGNEGHILAERIRALAPTNTPARSGYEQIADYFGGAVGALPAGIVQWMGGVPLAALSGITIAEEMARAQNRRPTTYEYARAVVVEAFLRKFLGAVVQRPMGPITAGLTFAGSSAIANTIHGRTPDQIGLDAALQFIMGTIGRRISPVEMARVREAQEAAARGEGLGALHHLDPILRANAEVIARAAYERTISLETLGPTVRGTDVGRPRSPRPRPPQVPDANVGTRRPLLPVVRAAREADTRTRPTPAPRPGMVRMYHGGYLTQDHTGPLWFTSDRNYAQGWASRDPNMRLWYVDVPRSHKIFETDYPDQTVDQGFTVNVELPGDIASRRRPFVAGEIGSEGREPPGRPPGTPPPSPPAIVPPAGPHGPPLPPPSPPRVRMNPVPAENTRLARERGESVIATNMTLRERADAMVRDFTDRFERAMRGIGIPERYNYITQWMRGNPHHIPPEVRAYFDEAQRLQNQQYISEGLTGDIHYEFRKNYFHLFWKPRSRDAASRYGADTAALGPGGRGRVRFERQKVFNDLEEGRQAGFDPASSNPGVYVAARLEAGNRAVQRVLTMTRLDEAGLAIRQDRFNAEMPLLPGRRGALGQREMGPYRGWQMMQVGTRRWLVHPKVAKLVEWGLGVDQASLARFFNLAEHGAVAEGGRAMARAWTALRNAVIPMKLSLSAFHAVHMLKIRTASSLSDVLYHAFGNAMPRADRLKAIRDMSAVGSEAHGQHMAEAFRTPGEGRPEQGVRPLSAMEEIELNLMIAGGHNPHMPSIYQLNAERTLRRIMNDEIPELLSKPPAGFVDQLARIYGVTSASLRASLAQVGRGVEAMQHDMFAVWIPSMKNAAYLNSAKQLIANRPDLLRGDLKSTMELRHELRAIQKSIDNRFGMMQYDKNFWPPTLKKILVNTMLSLGWNFGFAREFLHGPYRGADAVVRRQLTRQSQGTALQIDASRQQGESRIPEGGFNPRMANVGIYVAMSMLQAAILTFMLTGKPPQEVADFVYPKLPDGSRFNMQDFTREFGAFYFHAKNEGIGQGTLQLILSKMNSLMSSTLEALRGYDYYGFQTSNPNADIFTRTLQAARHIFVGSALPISMQSLPQTQGDPGRIAMSAAGFNPAPRYVEASGIVGRIQHAYRLQHPQQIVPWAEIERTQEIRNVRRTFDEYRRTGRPEYMQQVTQGLLTYARAHPERVGPNGQYLEAMVRSWMLPEGALLLRGLDPATQLEIMRNATPQERALYAPFLRRIPSNIRGLQNLP